MARKFLTGIDLSNQRAVNVADPSAGTDAVNLQTMQAFLDGKAWKEPVRAASTANINIASPGASHDGVTFTVGDRVLLKNQTAGAENGIYVWNGPTAAMTRAADNNSTAEMRAATVRVESGTTNADKEFVQNVDNVTIGTTTNTWVESGAGGGTTYTGGNGLTLSGTTFNVGAGTGITVTADTVAVDTAVVVRKYAADVGNGSATSLAVTHNLGTTDITYTLRVKATGEVVDTDATVTDANTLTLTFSTAPASAAYRVVVHG